MVICGTQMLYVPSYGIGEQHERAALLRFPGEQHGSPLLPRKSPASVVVLLFACAGGCGIRSVWPWTRLCYTVTVNYTDLFARVVLVALCKAVIPGSFYHVSCRG